MKFTFDKESLLAATIFAARGRPRNATGVMAHVMAEVVGDNAVRFSGTDGTQTFRRSISCESQRSEGRFCLPTPDFQEYVNRLRDGIPVEVGVEGVLGTVRQARSAKVFPLVDAADFPSLPEPTGEFIRVPATPLREGIASVAFCAARSGSHAFRGIQLQSDGKTLLLRALDGHRAAEFPITIPESGPFSCLAEAGALKDFSDALEGGDALLHCTPNGLFLSHQDKGCLTEMSIPLIAGSLPDISSYWPDSHALTVTMPLIDLRDGMKRVMPTGKEFIGKTSWGIGDGFVIVTNSEQGITATEEIPAQCEGEAMTFGVNGKYILEAALAVGCDDIVMQLRSPREAIHFSNNNGFRHFVMPCTP